MPDDARLDLDWAASYEEGPPRFVPGYSSLHTMAAVLLAETSGETGRVLVLGAGGGAELESFAKLHPGWRFVAVDSSRFMLDQARARMSAIEATDRVRWLETSISQAPTEGFDGCSCLLTMPFIPDDGSRLRCLGHIHSCLRAGAAFVMAHLAFNPNGATGRRSLRRYAAFARASGAASGLVATACEQMLPSLSLLSPAREAKLLKQAGFRRVQVFYRGLDWTGWVSYA